MNFATENLVFDPQIIRRFDVNGPRYTSYPTADRFVEAFDSEAAKHWLGKRNIGGISRPLSLYFHIPFCNTICYYCACNKIITKDHGRSAKYLKYLAKEVALQSQSLDGEHEVIQLHWGGGTPTFLSHDEMRQLMDTTRKHFKLLDGGEYSIEVDPRKVDTATVALLGELGFNRMSVGVQDFDERVQVAVNRVQSEEETATVIGAARANGFKSISVDLIYGLPFQREESFARTLDTVLAIGPDRIALYSYAHVTWVAKQQRGFERIAGARARGGADDRRVCAGDPDQPDDPAGDHRRIPGAVSSPPGLDRPGDPHRPGGPRLQRLLHPRRATPGPFLAE